MNTPILSSFTIIITDRRGDKRIFCPELLMEDHKPYQVSVLGKNENLEVGI